MSGSGRARRLRFAAAAAVLALSGAPAAARTVVTGDPRTWHKITVTFSGPDTSEKATPNPFLDYRLDVTFVHKESGRTYLVPGYYAADGNAANTGAASGNRWRAHLAPDAAGKWTYRASFRTGQDVAASDDPGAGVSAGHLDGEKGSFTVHPTDKRGRDLRGKGRLEYVGAHYLRFAGTGDFFLKQGADAPENFLAYADFDGPFKTDGHKDNLVKTWAPHVRDWRPGDPTWRDGKGKGIIGAVNYLASEGMNVFSFLPMNIGGDDRNVFPYLDYHERLRMDCSRLDQWEIVFEHADRMGMYLHFKTQETENDQLLDGGALGTERRLYYRELIARFGHHLALNWNLGEENTNTDRQRREFARYFRDHDPYRHNIVVHTYPGDDDKVYTPLLGGASSLTGTSLQLGSSRFTDVHGRVKEWVEKSARAGKPWVVACDEPGDASHALVPDADDPTHNDARKNALWGTLMAGGAGDEWYFGYRHAHSDLTCQDFRSRDLWWDQCRHALRFFEDNDVPFWVMQSADSLTSADDPPAGGDDYCFAAPGLVYVVYLRNGGTTELDLGVVAREYQVRWYDPRSGGALQGGNVAAVSGPGRKSIGEPPREREKDWVALVKAQGDVETCRLTVVKGTGGGEYPEGAEVRVFAGVPPDGETFDRWTGDAGDLADARSAATTVTMPAHGVTVEATYREAGPADEGQAQPGAGARAAEIAVVSFTLIDADTDRPVPGFDPIPEGAVLKLGALPTRRLNVRANASGAGVGSVRFSLDEDALVKTENSAPFALAGDSNGDYSAWTPSPGEHALTATPHTGRNGGGEAGRPVTVRFTVVE